MLAELHLLTPAEQSARFSQLWDRYKLHTPPPRQTRIDHFVVLLMENRGADTIFGCMGLDGFDGVPAAGKPLYRDPRAGAKRASFDRLFGSFSMEER